MTGTDRAGSGFAIETPTLSRGTASRDAALREPGRLAARWPTARVLRCGPNGAIDCDDDQPRWLPSAGESPPPGAVLLGSVDGTDFWAAPDDAVVGPTLRDIGAVLSDTDAGLVVAAAGLLAWHSRAAFCPTCGAASVAEPSGWSRTCPQQHQEFPRTDPAVIVLIHDGNDQMILARQPIWAPGRYSVLAGFTEAGESLEGTVHREVAEEIGVQVSDIRYLGSQPWPFPRSLMIGFSAMADPGQPLRPQDGEIEDARWVTRQQVRAALSGPGWSGAVSELVADCDFDLPGSISIARRMIEGWAAVD